MFKNSDTDVSSEDTDTITDDTTPAPIPDQETWWEEFQRTMSLYQLQEMQKMLIGGMTNAEIMQHFKSKQPRKEEFWLGVIEQAERERKILEKENRAERKKQKQLEKVRELAEWHKTHPPEDMWQDQFSCNE